MFQRLYFSDQTSLIVTLIFTNLKKQFLKKRELKHTSNSKQIIFFDNFSLQYEESFVNISKSTH